MKKALIVSAALIAVVAIAACTSSTTNNSGTTTPDLGATLNTHFAKNYTLIQNFARWSEANETPVYSGIIQDANGTQRVITVTLANSTSEAQKTFEEQKAGLPAALNTTFKTNTSTHFVITNKNASISGWIVQSKIAGPFGLSLDSAYVLVSQDVQKLPTETSKVTVSVTTGAG